MEKAIKNVKLKRVLDEGITRTVKDDNRFNRVYYVRYADDFLIGIVGSKKEARNVEQAIINYLTNKMHFSCNKEKSKLTHGTEYTKYLGTLIKWHMLNRVYKKEEFHTSVKMQSYNRPTMYAPIEDLLDRLTKRGISTKRKNNKKLVRSTSYRALTMLPNEEIVKRFNSMISGLLNYYSFVGFKSKL